MTDQYSSSDDPAATPTPAPTELQQLEAALRAKAISPELFATLAAQLRPSPTPAAPAAEPPVHPGSATSPAELPSLLSLFESPPAAPVPVPTPVAVPIPAFSPTPVPVPVPAPLVAPPTAAPPLPVSAAATPVRVASPMAAAPPMARPMPPPTAPPPMPAYAPASALAPAPASAPTDPPRRNGLTTALAALGGVGLLGLGFYLYVDSTHPSEDLTGPQPTPTEESASARLSIPAATVAAPEIVRVAPRAVPVADSGSSAAGPPAAATDETPAPESNPAPEETADVPAPENSPAAIAAATPAPVPAAPEPDDDEATQKVRAVLADYYADLFAPPLAAEKYFAPQVERLYIQQRLTPTQINATITQSFFPDNQKAVYQVEPGTLQVSTPAQDGSRTATYREACRLFRVSRGRYQRLRTQVRVKFDADYRITFLRQEKMLENVFE